MKLTVAAINAAQPSINKNGKTVANYIGDGNGLWLQVSPSGAKSWLFIYRSQVTRTQREYGMGSVIATAQALTAVRATVTLIRAKMNPQLRMPGAAPYDPIEERKAALAAAKVAGVTFGDMMNKVIAKEQPLWKVTNGVCLQLTEWERTRDKYCLAIRDKLISTLTMSDFVAVIEPIWTESNPTAKRVVDRMDKTIALATFLDLYTGKTPGMCVDHIMPKVAAEEKHHAMLGYHDVPAFMTKLDGVSGTVVKAIAFTILTAVRTANTIGMLWSEVDFVNRLWTIPACRMKIEKRGDVAVAHIVPLSDAAIAVLESVRGLHAEIVFPGAAKGGFLAKGSMNEKLTDEPRKGGMDLLGQATMHGMRAAFTTWVNEETPFPAEDREFALAHVKKAEVAAYQRGTSVEKRRVMMQAWANYATGKTNVSALRPGAKPALSLVAA